MSRVALVVIALGGTAAADGDAFVRARLPIGPEAAAPGIGATVDAGWGGAHATALGAVGAEALVYDRITVRAGVTYDVGRTKPAASASYAIMDPYRDAIGLLAGIAFKTEGLTEPEGEVEATLAIARRIGGGLLSGSLTFGADPDFHDHDGEVAAALVAPISARVALGGVSRVRSGLGSTTDLAASWDALAGGVARAQLGVYTLTVIGGLEALGATTGGTRTGPLGTLALGAWW